MNTQAELPDHVDTSTGTAGWRIADGCFVRGRQGQEETRTVFLGYLRRVGIHEGTLDDGSEYAKLEVDLETRDGIQSVGATLKSATSGKPSWTACINLARIIGEFAEGELLQLEAKAGKTPNRFGRRTTYVNGFRVDPITLKPTEIRFDRIEAATENDLRDVLDDLLAEVRNHPAFGPRPGRHDDEDELGTQPGTAFDAFCSCLAELGWPPFKVASVEYLAMAAKTAKVKAFSAPTEVPDDVWNAMVTAALKRRTVPDSLKAKAAAAPVPDDNYDPFA